MADGQTPGKLILVFTVYIGTFWNTYIYELNYIMPFTSGKLVIADST